MFASSSIFALLSAAALVYSHPIDHDHVERGSLLSSFGIRDWAQPKGHPVEKLFERQATTGSFNAANYPSDIPDPTAMPDAWKQALAQAVAANQIPSIVQTKDGVYPSSVDPTSAEICASAFQCRYNGTIPDIWDAPDGMLGVSFDDGPTTASPQLYDFLKANNQKATHFFIGGNIRDNPDIFMQAFNNGNDMAVHTYTHRWMTSLSNEEAMAELGWTMQIIYDMTGGRVPRYWRPPYGDSDNRIRAIARLFGLQQVDWNQDTDDWEIGEKKITLSQIEASLQKFISGPKSPGLIILEHELYPGTVEAFINAYPLMKSSGWDVRNIPDLFGKPYYQNAQDNTAAVTQSTILSGDVAGSSNSSSSSVVASSTSGVTSTQPMGTTTTSAASQTSAAQNKSSNSAQTVGVRWLTVGVASVSALVGALML